MADLGTIERVELRQVWGHEAQDFTPWLAENLDNLGAALGMDLELQSAEAPVGSFALDILAHDLGSGRPVIIENQLEATNHDHLGKLLTYAAGYDAYAAVWLVREFRDEHRQALDWLNQRTGEDTAFFGVVVEAIRIDGSRPAPQFRVVAMPNEWQKQNQTVKGVPSGDSADSSTGQLYRAFFQDLVDTLRTEHQFTKSKTSTWKSWRNFASGVSDVRYYAAFDGQGKCRIEVYFGSGNAETNKNRYDRLQESKEDIEGALGVELVWEPLDGKKASRISVARDGSITDADDTLEELRDWMVQWLLKFREVFTPRLRELVQ